MTIHPVVTVTEIRGGVAARAIEIGLASHGRDQGRAEAALRSVITTWARCLLLDGELDRSLARLGIVTEMGGEDLIVDLDVRRVTD